MKGPENTVFHLGEPTNERPGGKPRPQGPFVQVTWVGSKGEVTTSRIFCSLCSQFAQRVPREMAPGWPMTQAHQELSQTKPGIAGMGTKSTAKFDEATTSRVKCPSFPVKR